MFYWGGGLHLGKCKFLFQVEALTNVLEYIFDRNAALLPGYFIVNEILKSYPETGNWPHWTLVPMVAKFLNSFRNNSYIFYLN